MESRHEPLKAAISSYVELTDREWAALVSLFTPLHAPKGTRLVDLGSVATHLFFIQKGAIRKYYLDDIAVHTGFYLENTFVTALSSFFCQSPAAEVVETLEESELWCLEKSDYDLMNQASVKINDFTRPLIETLLMELHNQVSLLKDAPQKRINYLLQQKKQWIHRVPHAYLASFLDLPLPSFTHMLQGLQNTSGPI